MRVVTERVVRPQKAVSFGFFFGYLGSSSPLELSGLSVFSQHRKPTWSDIAVRFAILLFHSRPMSIQPMFCSMTLIAEQEHVLDRITFQTFQLTPLTLASFLPVKNRVRMGVSCHATKQHLKRLLGARTPQSESRKLRPTFVARIAHVARHCVDRVDDWGVIRPFFTRHILSNTWKSFSHFPAGLPM